MSTYTDSGPPLKFGVLGCANIARQFLALTDHLDAHAFFVKGRQFAAQIKTQQAHEFVDFSKGSTPVLARETVKRQVSDFQFARSFNCRAASDRGGTIFHLAISPRRFNRERRDRLSIFRISRADDMLRNERMDDGRANCRAGQDARKNDKNSGAGGVSSVRRD